MTIINVDVKVTTKLSVTAAFLAKEIEYAQDPNNRRSPYLSSCHDYHFGQEVP